MMTATNSIIKPIETIYKEYRFRSRLEARWAIFFDVLGIGWQYEVEGFDLGNTWYLPDFWLPDYKWWVEIKPDKIEVDDSKIARLSNQPAISILLKGNPWFNEYKMDLFYAGKKLDCIDGYSFVWAMQMPVKKIGVVMQNYDGSRYLWASEVLEIDNQYFWPTNEHHDDYLMRAYKAARQARF